MDVGSAPPDRGPRHDAGEQEPRALGPTSIKPESVSLDRNAIKLLASDTRLEILKALKKRRMTVSELASKLSLGKSTVHEHVGKLVEGGFITRHDDPQREWVYYELSGKAKRLLSPASAKIVLLLGGLIALGVGIVALAALSPTVPAPAHLEVTLLDDGGGSDMVYWDRSAWAEDDAAAGDDAVGNPSAGQDASGDRTTATEPKVGDPRIPSSGPAIAGSPHEYRVRVADASGAAAAEAELHLLTPEALEALQANGELPDEGARPLDAVAQGDGEYAFTLALPEGTYYVYAQAANGVSDASRNPAQIVVHAARVQADVGPILVGADDGRPIRIQVAADGVPLTGALRVEGPLTAGPRVLDVVNGEATLQGGYATAGALQFDFRTDVPGSDFAAANGTVPVEEPHVLATVDSVTAGTPEPVTITVHHPERGPVQDAMVHLGEAPGLTDRLGQVHFTVNATEVSALPLRVGDHDAGELPVDRAPTLAWEPVRPVAGENVTLRAHDPLARTPLEGVQVVLADADLGRTDARGELSFLAPAAPGGTLRVTPPQQTALNAWMATRPADNGTGFEPSLSDVDVDAFADTVDRDAGLVHLRLRAANSAGEPVLRNVTLQADDRDAGTYAVRLDAGETRDFRFTLYGIPEDAREVQVTGLGDGPVAAPLVSMGGDAGDNAADDDGENAANDGGMEGEPEGVPGAGSAMALVALGLTALAMAARQSGRRP